VPRCRSVFIVRYRQSAEYCFQHVPLLVNNFERSRMSSRDDYESRAQALVENGRIEQKRALVENGVYVKRMNRVAASPGRE
jgi:hypothetical protein